MNLAFTTLLVFITLFPGFFFQMGYHSGPFSKKYRRFSVYNNIAAAILPALIYHVSSISLINIISFLPDVSFKAIGTLLLGKDTELVVKTFEISVGGHFHFIALYIALSVAIGGIIGLILAKIVRAKNWDCKYPLLRFDNKWHYVMNGEILVWKEKNTDEEKRLENLKRIRGKSFEVSMECLVEVAGNAYIYEGIVSRYFLNKEGLDRIHLNDCTRKPFPKTEEAYKENKENAVFLNDDFVLFRETIININIDYNSDQGVYNTQEAAKAYVDDFPEDLPIVIVGKDGNEKIQDPLE